MIMKKKCIVNTIMTIQINNYKFSTLYIMQSGYFSNNCIFLARVSKKLQNLIWCISYLQMLYIHDEPGYIKYYQ